ncbi:unnamed protein product [Cochlearia groenlandica]
MKIIALLFIAIVIVATFSLPTKAIDVGGSRSKRNGESCHTNEFQSCFGLIARGTTMSTTCCEILKEQQSCLCGEIETSKIDIKVISPRLRSCGISDLKC